MSESPRKFWLHEVSWNSVAPGHHTFTPPRPESSCLKRAPFLRTFSTVLQCRALFYPHCPALLEPKGQGPWMDGRRTSSPIERPIPRSSEKREQPQVPFRKSSDVLPFWETCNSLFWKNIIRENLPQVCSLQGDVSESGG